MDAIIKLRKKVANESMQERQQIQQSHRHYRTTHQMKVVPAVHNGQYLESLTQKTPLQEIAGATGLPLPQSNLTQRAI